VKKLLISFAGLALAMMLAWPAQSSAQAADPVAVLYELLDALNTHNVEDAIALFVDDAVVTQLNVEPGTPNPHATFTGKEQIRGWLEGQPPGLRVEVIGAPQVIGDKATFRNSLTGDFLTGMGIDKIEQLGEATFQDGKIKSFTLEETPESKAKIQEAMARASSAGMPATGRGILDNHIMLLALVFLLTLAGVGVLLGSRLYNRG
jgi:hypothetical protein